MPELPEVEVTVQAIRAELVHQKIHAIEIQRYDLRWPIESTLADKLLGQQINAVNRRSKYIVIELTKGTLLLHLGMSGSIRFLSPQANLKKHDHFTLSTAKQRMCFNDPRRFGAILYTEEPIKTHPRISNLGVEPLSKSFDVSYLQAKLAKRQRCIKSCIMDAQIVVGVGNIYASESLFLSGIHPLRAAYSLNNKELHRLIEQIQHVLKKAIRQGGTTLKDFHDPDGNAGYFQQTLSVYGRQGLPCVRCKKTLKLAKIQGRSTVFCNECQH